jgi:hypothetical protein
MDNQLQQKFITDIKKWTRKKKSIKIRRIKAVSIVILTKNGNNVILGKEMYGKKKGLYNLFGGKNDHGSLWKSLFDEIYEELGLILNAQSFINAYRGHYYLNKALIFALEIDGIDPKLFLKMRKKRIHAPEQFREMKSIQSIPIKKLLTKKITNYVKAVIKFIETQSRKIKRNKKYIKVNLRDFKSSKTKYSTII